jgi:hypothetical protein
LRELRDALGPLFGSRYSVWDLGPLSDPDPEVIARFKAIEKESVEIVDDDSGSVHLNPKVLAATCCDSFRGDEAALNFFWAGCQARAPLTVPLA